MARCNLCEADKTLIKTSHIIPDWMYEGLFTEKHKLHKIQPAHFIAGDKRIQMPSSGEYEGDLLCEGCDNVVIGQLEDYARRIFKGKGLPDNEMPVIAKLTIPSGYRFTHVRNLNYMKLKLFLLSILWRASISKRDFFKDVRLGPHEKVLQRMILTSNPGVVDDYPIWVISFLAGPSGPKDIIAEPGRLNDQQGTRYIFIIAGFAFVFHISKHQIPDFILDFTINPAGEMKILHVPDGMGWELVMNYFCVKSSG